MRPLTWNADRETLPGNRRRTSFSVKWRNYLAESWAWQPIDLIPRQVSGDWVFDRAPYALVLPGVGNGTLTFESTNRYDLHTRRIMPDAKVGVQKRYPTALPVPGAVVEGGILFAGAFPSLNADRLVICHEQKVKDLIVFRSEPPGGGPVEVPLEIECHGLPVLEGRGHGQPPREADLRAERDILHGLTFATGRFRGVRVKPLAAWDSAGRRQAIVLRGRVVGARFVGRKVIPRSFFRDAAYPVYADTTSTFYPDPDPETATTDGGVRRVPDPNEAWGTIRAGDGTAALDSSDTLQIVAVKGMAEGEWFQLERTLCLFDTSPIGEAEVTAATLSLFGSGKSDRGDQAVAAGPGTTASDTALAASDFQSNTSATTYASVDVTDWSTSGYNDFVLDAAGIAAIDGAGITKFCLKLSGDTNNSEPAGLTAFQNVSAVARSADQAGTSEDPKLVVEHAGVGDHTTLFLHRRRRRRS